MAKEDAVTIDERRRGKKCQIANNKMRFHGNILLRGRNG
jgi:hypothetical protein